MTVGESLAWQIALEVTRLPAAAVLFLKALVVVNNDIDDELQALIMVLLNARDPADPTELAFLFAAQMVNVYPNARRVSSSELEDAGALQAATQALNFRSSLLSTLAQRDLLDLLNSADTSGLAH